MGIWVIKYGGSVSGEPTHLLEEIARLARRGERIAVVHGGGPEISQQLARMGHTTAFLDGQRVTDETARDVAEMVLAGRVGKRIVRALQQFGARAAGISGEDGGLVAARLYDDSGRLGLVGRVAAVDVHLLAALFAAGYVPVIAPLGCDGRGDVLNINADFVAGAVAGALRADAFVLATDVPGVRASRDARSALPELSPARAREMIAAGAIAGGMIPKVEAALAAVAAGAAGAHIVDGRQAGILDGIARGRIAGTRIGGGDEGGAAEHAGS